MQNMLRPILVRDALPILLRHEKHFLSLIAKRSKLMTYCQLKHYSSSVSSNGVNNSSEISGVSKRDVPDIPSNIIVAADKPVADSDDEDPGFKAALSAVIPNIPPPIHVDIVPGKGPPPVPPVDCCMSGCANCVWIQYAEELRDYFTSEQGNIRAKEAIEKIDNPGLQMFLKLELGLL